MNTDGHRLRKREERELSEKQRDEGKKQFCHWWHDSVKQAAAVARKQAMLK